jgi:hypothetical protein
MSQMGGERAFMHLISAPRNLLISLTTICGAEILQTVRKLRGALSAAQNFAAYDRAEQKKSRKSVLCATVRSLASSFRTVCLICAPLETRGSAAF